MNVSLFTLTFQTNTFLICLVHHPLMFEVEVSEMIWENG